MADNEKTGWEREYRTHFDENVVNYDKVRWEYPNELYADIFEYAEGVKDKKAIEIGAGTGKATTPFLEADCDVTAVEMSANMAAFLIEKYTSYATFRVIVDTFENVSLEESSYDIIYAASAFHWVDAQIGCPKSYRLLKNGGVFALFRNNAVTANDDKLYEVSQALYDKHYYSYYKRDNRSIPIAKMTYDDFLNPMELHRGFRLEGLEQFGFRDITMKLYDATISYSADDYVSLLDTYSDHKALPEENRAALYSGIRNAILNHGGQQKLNCIYQLYMGRKP